MTEKEGEREHYPFEISSTCIEKYHPFINAITTAGKILVPFSDLSSNPNHAIFYSHYPKIELPKFL